MRSTQVNLLSLVLLLSFYINMSEEETVSVRTQILVFIKGAK